MMKKPNLEKLIWPTTTTIGGSLGFLVSAGKIIYESTTGDASLNHIYSYVKPVIEFSGWGYFIGSGIDTIKYVANKIKEKYKE